MKKAHYEMAARMLRTILRMIASGDLTAAKRIVPRLEAPRQRWTQLPSNVRAQAHPSGESHP